MSTYTNWQPATGAGSGTSFPIVPVIPFQSTYLSDNSQIEGEIDPMMGSNSSIISDLPAAQQRASVSSSSAENNRTLLLIVMGGLTWYALSRIENLEGKISVIVPKFLTKSETKLNIVGRASVVAGGALLGLCLARLIRHSTRI